LLKSNAGIYFGKKFGLPLLSVAQEFRRLKNLEAARDFAKFTERFRGRVTEKVVAKIGRRQGNPKWKPEGMLSGMALQK
jgi:hypothetical protein